jgi:hypothetical protein
LSRFDGKLDPAGSAEIAPAELLTAFELQTPQPQDRLDAIARCLSASEGWKEAVKLMGGAFAPDVAQGRVKSD